MTLLPQPIPPDPVEGELGHFDHTNWVTASLIALDDAAARTDGGIYTGDLQLDGASLLLDGDDSRHIDGRSSAEVLRWRMELGDSSAESVGNAGSRFMLSAYGDDGIKRFTVLQADRINGLLQVAGDPSSDLGIATKQYVDKQMPIGAIIMWGGTAAPTGWHLCDGSAHGSSALQGILGSVNTPNLRDRFIVGAGSLYAQGATGGLSTVTLTGAQSGEKGHNHTASAGNDNATHTHSGTTAGEAQDHSHYSSLGGGDHVHGTYASNLLSAEGDFNPAGSGHQFLIGSGSNIGGGGHSHAGQSGGRSAVHTHTFSTGGRSTYHQHAITIVSVGASNASQAHENKPPYYALTFIIKKA